MGFQLLAGANRAAIAVAHAVGGRFVRAEGFVFAAVADEGLLDEADAGPLLRYRRAIGADGVVVTGRATGDPAVAGEVAAVRAAVRIPVAVGSGVTPATVAGLLEHADALIVGSWYKEGGHWAAPPDPARAGELAAAVRTARAWSG